MTFSKLCVSPDGRHLMTEKKEPFFYLGDTAWELFHRMTREEIEWYFDDRAAKGFTVIQAVALAEYGGLTEPNVYGRVPLLKNGAGQFDPTLPDTEGDS